ncbi:hypothetical protein [Halobacillus sp. BBL2006]|uniref:hypothetical protein n=1 Tax=Halobacillus sp. BBL2006 TaxID=1543706 RepID=UPI000541AA02|nr:hypothetical protein [Halobacillus sp. BBL2006]KHE67003.1 hypothetical protein LD39_19805 [Halobacillus sp. BBL2006]
MIYRRDGMGGSRYYPAQSEIMIYCTFVHSGHRYIILRYLDLPFCFRVIKRKGLDYLDNQVLDCLLPYLDRIDEGQYDDDYLAKSVQPHMD